MDWAERRAEGVGDRAGDVAPTRSLDEAWLLVPVTLLTSRTLVPSVCGVVWALPGDMGRLRRHRGSSCSPSLILLWVGGADLPAHRHLHPHGPPWRGSCWNLLYR